MTTQHDETMRELAELEAQYDYQVVGKSGRMYSDVPKEVWDRIPSVFKRIVAREK